jgi:hypothetical protein
MRVIAELNPTTGAALWEETAGDRHPTRVSGTPAASGGRRLPLCPDGADGWRCRRARAAMVSQRWHLLKEEGDAVGQQLVPSASRVSIFARWQYEDSPVCATTRATVWRLNWRLTGADSYVCQFAGWSALSWRIYEWADDRDQGVMDGTTR